MVEPGRTLALSADLIAVAVVAAAEEMGADPIKAVAARGGPIKRSVTAAAAAIAEATGLSRRRASDVLGLGENAVTQAERLRSPEFVRARQAAARALADFAAEVLAEDDDDAPAAAETARGGAPAPVLKVVSAAEVLAARKQAEKAQARAEAIPPPVAAIPPPPVAADTLSGRILDCLATGPCTAAGLASMLDAKESVVGSALSKLRHEGRIEAGDVPPQGARYVRWSMKPTEAAGG